MVRVKTAIAWVVLAALASLVVWRAWSVVATRPRIVRPSPWEAFGIERADAPAPPLELTAIDGSRFSLAGARGQVVFLNFWATWCAPCREEMPSMLALGQELMALHPGKFKMVAVSVDEGWSPVRDYFAGPPFGGPPAGPAVVLDTAQVATRAFYCTARGGVCPDLKFPETYIVDKSGRLVAFVVGPRDWTDPAARAFLERLIGS